MNSHEFSNRCNKSSYKLRKESRIGHYFNGRIFTFEMYNLKMCVC